MDAETLARAKDLAAKHLGRRMRSERELEAYLEQKGLGPAVVARVIRDFRRVGLIDDRVMARDWAERHLARQPSGRRAVEERLLARGVRGEIVDEVLGEIYAGESERELALRALRGHLARVKHLVPDARRRRLFRFLIQRGFSEEIVSEFFEEMDP